jgi:hypothetical protein
VKDATTEATTIRAWWTVHPDANVGIATGAASGLVVLDVDPRHGGNESLAALEREHGMIPATLASKTGGGGRHIFFAHPGVPIRNAVCLAPGLDVRGDGGYVAAPPSTHASGRLYIWERGGGLEEVPVGGVPHWLLARLSGDDSHGEQNPREEWVALVRDGADLGRRNDAVARLAGYLLRRRPAPRVVLELLRAWNESRCRPPLANRELVATVDSIAQHEMRRRAEG